MQIKVLTYNLFWWNLFDLRGGGDAGKLVAANTAPQPFDFMGFQECEDVVAVLRDGGLLPEYAYIKGDHALALAYRSAAWELIASSTDLVAEDMRVQWYGVRGLLWGRFRNKENGKTVFFATHHGPLPLNSGGKCGWQATAFNIMRVIAQTAQEGDALFLVGDFNADLNTGTLKQLDSRFHRIFSGKAFGGIDHIFSSCSGANVIDTRSYGNGGSDHDALGAVVEV